MTNPELEMTAEALVAPGKGILAADETVPTLTKRFDALRIQSTSASRRDYREMLLTAPGAPESISGVILHDETIRQQTTGGGGRSSPRAPSSGSSPASRWTAGRSRSPAPPASA